MPDTRTEHRLFVSPHLRPCGSSRGRPVAVTQAIVQEWEIPFPRVLSPVEGEPRHVDTREGWVVVVQRRRKDQPVRPAWVEDDSGHRFTWADGRSRTEGTLFNDCEDAVHAAQVMIQRDSEPLPEIG